MACFVGHSISIMLNVEVLRIFHFRGSVRGGRVPFVTARNGAVFAVGTLRHFLSHGRFAFARSFCTDGNTWGETYPYFHTASRNICGVSRYFRKLFTAVTSYILYFWHIELNDANNSKRNWAKFIILRFASFMREFALTARFANYELVVNSILKFTYHYEKITTKMQECAF